MMRFVVAISFSSVAYATILGAATPVRPDVLPSNLTRIDFERDPDGKPVALGTLAGGIWSRLGVTFDANDFVGDPPAGQFNITSPPNVLSGDNSRSFEPIRARFDPLVSVVGAWGFDFVLEVFDRNGVSLGQIGYTDGSPGLLGGTKEYGFLGIQSDVPIQSAHFRTFFPENQVFGFHIDDLVYLPIGDWDGSGRYDVSDIDLLSAAVREGSSDLRFDLNRDGLVDESDREMWVHDLKGTWFGDANLDGQFNTGDLARVFVWGR